MGTPDRSKTCAEIHCIVNKFREWLEVTFLSKELIANNKVFEELIISINIPSECEIRKRRRARNFGDSDSLIRFRKYDDVYNSQNLLVTTYKLAEQNEQNF